MPWTLVSVPLFAAVAFGGQVRVVGSAPAPYLALQDAVNDAGDGDIILVRTGTHSSLRVQGKSVTVVAENGATVIVSSGARITDLKSQSVVVLSGITANGRHEPGFTDVRYGLFVRGGLGQVFGQDCGFQGGSGPHDGCIYQAMPDGVRVESAPGVSLTNCVLRGGTLDGTTPGATQAAGLTAVGLALVSCDQVSAYGGAGGHTCPTSVPYPYTWDAPSGGHGAVIQLPAFAFFSGGDFHGRIGASLDPPCYATISVPGNGGSAIGWGAPSAIRCLAVTLQAGQGGLNMNTQCAPGFGPFQGSPGLASVPTASLLSGTPRILRGPRLVRDTQSIALTLTGLPGETVELAVQRAGLTHQFDAAQSGVVHLSTPRWRSVGTVPASGVLSVSFRAPGLSPLDPALTIFAQARFMHPVSGVTCLSNAWVIAEVDSTY